MDRNWSFMKSGFWIFSHFFVASATIVFVILSLWQFERLAERQKLNDELASLVDSEPAQFDASDIYDEFQPVQLEGVVIDSDFIRIVNRTQDGAVGEHVVALVKVDNSLIFVNRGFVIEDGQVGDLPEAVIVEGYIRNSFSKGFFDVADALNSEIAPRMDIPELSKRLDPGAEVYSQWIQVSDSPTEAQIAPRVLDLPPQDNGNHLSYALQWLMFAGLTVLFYYLICRRRASQGVLTEP